MVTAHTFPDSVLEIIFRSKLEIKISVILNNPSHATYYQAVLYSED